MTDALALGIFAAVLGLSVAMGEGLRRVGWRPESSRRAVHAAVGLATAASPLLFERPAGIYLLAVAFVAANLVAVRRRYLPGMHGIERVSWGTVTFPLALIAALALCWSLDAGRVFILQTAFAVLALADPAASLVGTRAHRPRPYTVAGATKSVAGSLAFVVVAAAVAATVLSWTGPATFGWTQITAGALTAAVVAAAAEALGRRGWDNLWIVLAVIVPLTSLHAHPEAAGLHLVALAVALAFGAASYRARFLDLSGALAASILAWMVIALGGAAWAVPAVTFFVLSSLLSRLGRRRKQAAEARAAKGSRRDVGQVVANGGVGAALLAAHTFVPAPALYLGFVGAFAAAAADTWGTEIGTWAGWPTRRLAVGPRVPPGTSGGMSVPGTLGALAGAAVVVASALAVAGASVRAEDVGAVGLAVTLAGLAAAVVDSTLGATVQARFRAADGSLTEREWDGATLLPLAAGLRWIDNDLVNVACTLVGAGLAILLVL